MRYLYLRKRKSDCNSQTNKNEFKQNNHGIWWWWSTYNHTQTLTDNTQLHALTWYCIKNCAKYDQNNCYLQAIWLPLQMSQSLWYNYPLWCEGARWTGLSIVIFLVHKECSQGPLCWKCWEISDFKSFIVQWVGILYLNTAHTQWVYWNKMLKFELVNVSSVKKWV